MEAERRGALHRTDIVIAALAGWATVFLLVAGRWTRGWWQSALIFSALGAAPFLLRAAARRSPRLRLANVLASFWLLPAAVIGHQALGPVVDAIHPCLVDPWLARADLRVFGVLPAEWLSRQVSPAITELLLVCYYGYFVWPLLLGVVLYLRGRREAYEHYTLALALTFATTFAAYAWIPAVGPRFFLAQTFSHPLEGVWLTPWLDSAMRGPHFMRDCFPSGHTAVTLVVLTFAHRHARGFFWKMLPAGLGLIAATLVGRFHYGVDLLFALPLAVLTVAASGVLMRPRPVPARFPVPANASATWARSTGQLA